MPSRLIALCGYPGVGKDKIAEYLVANYGYTRVSFADPMRKALLALDPLVRVNQCPHCQKPHTESLSSLVARYGWDQVKRAHLDVRTYLQRMGTEAGRDIHGDDCWVDIALDTIAKCPGPVVVTDLRFGNELTAMQQLDAEIVHVMRPGFGKVNNHASEQMNYGEVASKAIVNDGSLEDLHKAIRQVLGLDVMEELDLD